MEAIPKQWTAIAFRPIGSNEWNLIPGAPMDVERAQQLFHLGAIRVDIKSDRGKQYYKIIGK